MFGQTTVKMAKNQSQPKKRTTKQPEVRPIDHKTANLATMGRGGAPYILEFYIFLLHL